MISDKFPDTHAVYFHGPNAEVLVGRRVELTCSVKTLHHAPTVTIYHDGNVISEKRGMLLDQLSFDGVEHIGIRYIISSVTLGDAGPYRCEVKWSTPSGSSTEGYILEVGGKLYQCSVKCHYTYIVTPFKD